MSSHSKRYKSHILSYPTSSVALLTAVDCILNATHKAKFKESIDVCIHLGIDSKKSDQNIKGFAVYPFEVGKQKKILFLGNIEEFLARKLMDNQGFEEEEVESRNANGGEGNETNEENEEQPLQPPRFANNDQDQEEENYHRRNTDDNHSNESRSDSDNYEDNHRRNTNDKAQKRDSRYKNSEDNYRRNTIDKNYKSDSRYRIYSDNHRRNTHDKSHKSDSRKRNYEDNHRRNTNDDASDSGSEYRDSDDHHRRNTNNNHPEDRRNKEDKRNNQRRHSGNYHRNDDLSSGKRREEYEDDSRNVSQDPEFIRSFGAGADGRRSWRKRSRSAESESTVDEVIAKRNADFKINNINQRLFTPSKKNQEASTSRHQPRLPRLLTPRSLQREAGKEIAKRVKKSNEQYCSAGPPILQDNVPLVKFHEWQNNLFMFVEKLPGYVEGMLDKRPDYANMSTQEQKLLKDIYANIYVWLAKAGNQNTKVALKTKNIKTKPYPDIVGWWKSVNDIFKLSANEIDKRVKELDTVYQYIGEKSKAYYMRFELLYTSIKDLGQIMNDAEIGNKIFKGLLTLNKQILHSFMAGQNIVCDLQSMETMCDYLDSLNDDPVPHRETIGSVNSLATAMNATMIGSPDAYPPGQLGEGQQMSFSMGSPPQTQHMNQYGSMRGGGGRSQWSSRRQPSANSQFGSPYRGGRGDRGHHNGARRQSGNNGTYTHEYERTYSDPKQSEYNYQQRLLNQVHGDRIGNLPVLRNSGIPIQIAPKPDLTYQPNERGVYSWHLNGKAIEDTSTVHGVNTKQNSPSNRQNNQQQARRAHFYGPQDAASRAERDKNSRNSMAANFVSEVTDIITPYAYPFGLYDALFSKPKFNNRFKRDPMSKLLGYTDYLWGLQQLRDRDARKKWLPNNKLLPFEEYQRRSNRNNDLVCFMVHTVKTGASSEQPEHAESGTDAPATLTTSAPTASSVEPHVELSSSQLNIVIEFLKKLQCHPEVMEILSNQSLREFRSITEAVSDEAHTIIRNREDDATEEEQTVWETVDNLVVTVAVDEEMEETNAEYLRRAENRVKGLRESSVQRVTLKERF